jgi:hypothetical protein
MGVRAGVQVLKDVQVLVERETDLALLRDQLRSALARAGLSDPAVKIDAVAALPR